ncbi:TetR/AcrR family transcriptional regulator C-terminal domain-containing protein [Vagococcus xieshaowenii]|nr:TetR/AcrR family transcriptional regulator C-terminal domain-containing protein [Vagococcus xieshaowenii]
MTNLTKAALAETLKEMIKTCPLDKITVKDLADRCQVNRQTFYYHFRDIYELVDWIIEQNFLKKFEQFMQEDNLTKNLKTMSDYVDEHKAFSLNVYRSVGKERAERYINHHIEQWLVSYLFVESSFEHNEMQIKFYVYGITGFIVDWLEGTIDLSTEELCGKLLYIVKSELVKVN